MDNGARSRCLPCEGLKGAVVLVNWRANSKEPHEYVAQVAGIVPLDTLLLTMQQTAHSNLDELQPSEGDISVMPHHLHRAFSVIPDVSRKLLFLKLIPMNHMVVFPADTDGLIGT